MNEAIRAYMRTLQRRSAASRWGGLTPAQRAAEMSRVRRKGVRNSKRVARRSNTRSERPEATNDNK